MKKEKPFLILENVDRLLGSPLIKAEFRNDA